MKLSEIAKLVGGDLAGNPDVEIERVAKIEEAGAGDISFLANPKYRKYLNTTSASAILIGQNEPAVGGRTTPLHLIRVRDPYRSFLTLIDLFHPSPSSVPSGIHPSAVVAASATISSGVAIGAHVVIGERCVIGDRVIIHPGVVLAEGVEIDSDTILYANVTVREFCRIGKRVIVQPGTVIGSDGFGFAPTPDGTYAKIPQRGIVVVEDDVEIGANCSIDRATIGETRICRGAKLDNLIQVAHNVVVGEHSVIAAQTGISGSTKIGDHAIIAGQVGLVGHITIAPHTTLAAQSGIAKSITQPGKTYFGYPAKEHHRALRIEGVIRQLPELLLELQQLQQRVRELEQRLTIRHPETT
jgi:UDP-3-O-[3-hydroxymyristoyl] glucosamine N-acyltransferase